MPQLSLESADSLWDYATTAYSQPGIADLCLWFQDHCRSDVSVILFIGWCSMRGVLVDHGLLAQVKQKVSNWHQDVVVPLRGLRRELKGNSKFIELEAVCIFREKIKALELEAEHLELNALATLSCDENASIVPVSAQKRLIESSLIQYLQQLDCDVDAQIKAKIGAFSTCLFAEKIANK